MYKIKRHLPKTNQALDSSNGCMGTNMKINEWTRKSPVLKLDS